MREIVREEKFTMNNIETYLGSPRNLTPDQARDLIIGNLHKKYDDFYEISFDNLDITILTDTGNRYVDLGFQRDVLTFSQRLDRLLGIEPSLITPAHLIGKEYLFGGGFTIPYDFQDSDGKNYKLWVTLCREDFFDNLNLYLITHEQSHVVQKLGSRNYLINTIKNNMQKLKSVDLDRYDEELLCTIAGFIPLMNLGPGRETIEEILSIKRISSEETYGIVKRLLL